MKRKYSLKKNRDINNVFNLKNSIGNKYYSLYIGPSTNNQLRIAISISKRCGNAVRRNYEKRIVREVLREYLHLIIRRDYLLIIKVNATKLTFPEKKKQIENLLEQIIIKQGEQNEKKNKTNT